MEYTWDPVTPVKFLFIFFFYTKPQISSNFDTHKASFVAFVSWQSKNMWFAAALAANIL